MNALVESLPRRLKGVPGSVYVIHFDEPFHHARHYVGWTAGDDVDERMLRHTRGNGSRLLRAVNGEGIGWTVVRVWHNADRHFERWIKEQKQTAGFCPVCSEQPRKVRNG